MGNDTCKHGESIYERCSRCEYDRKQVAAIEDPFKSVSHAINGSSGSDALGTVAANEHPTLLGQIAKGIAIGVMRRTLYNPEWRPFDKAARDNGRFCEHFGRTLDIFDGSTFQLPRHPEHDGRLSCETVVGAELMARQAYI